MGGSPLVHMSGECVLTVLLAYGLSAAGAAAAQRPPPATARADSPKVTVVYVNDFERGAGREWSHRRLDATPKGKRKFLGQFVNETVSLKLDQLPPHAMVRISFDLFIILTWDGTAQTQHGPDVWQLRVAGGPALLRTTFQFAPPPWKQSFPGEHPDDKSDAQTGAAEKNTLGFRRTAPSEVIDVDAVYRLSFTLPHTGWSLQLDFSAALKGEGVANDESWGLDNVKVEVLPTAVRPAPKELEKLWGKLADKDAAVAYGAMWALIAAGTQAETFLTGKVALRPADAETVRRLLAELDHDDWRVRERPSGQLGRYGEMIRPMLVQALARTPSPEVRFRLEKLLETTKELPPQIRRARRALELLRWQRRASRPAGGSSGALPRTSGKGWPRQSRKVSSR